MHLLSSFAESVTFPSASYLIAHVSQELHAATAAGSAPAKNTFFASPVLRQFAPLQQKLENPRGVACGGALEGTVAGAGAAGAAQSDLKYVSKFALFCPALLAFAVCREHVPKKSDVSMRKDAHFTFVLHCCLHVFTAHCMKDG